MAKGYLSSRGKDSTYFHTFDAEMNKFKMNWQYLRFAPLNAFASLKNTEH